MNASMTFEELYTQEFAANVRHVKMRYNLAREEAEDIVQVGFIRLWHDYPTLAGIAAPVPYLRGRLRFLARQFLHSRHVSLSLDLPITPEEDATLLDVRDFTPHAPTVEDQALSHIEIQQVARQVMQWPLVEQIIFKMSVEGYGYDEIHRCMVATYGFQGTVKSVSHVLGRVRQELRQKQQVRKAKRSRVQFLSNGPWSVRYAACVQCGTTDYRYAAHGLCHRCYSAKRHQDIKAQVITPTRVALRQWARKHTACVSCGTTNVSHVAQGYCVECYAIHVRHRSRGYMRSRRSVVTLIK